jgi:hypothetical protein
MREVIFRSLRRVAIFLTVGLLAACGGGGGDAGSANPGGGGGTSGPRFTADYAPLNTGDRQLLRMTGGPASGSLSSETIGAPT